MKLENKITHDKEAVFLVFCRVLFRMDRLEKEIKALEEMPIMLNRYKEIQYKKIELAILEEFFDGEECKQYIIKDIEDNSYA